MFLYSGFRVPFEKNSFSEGTLPIETKEIAGTVKDTGRFFCVPKHGFASRETSREERGGLAVGCSERADRKYHTIIFMEV